MQHDLRGYQVRMPGAERATTRPWMMALGVVVIGVIAFLVARHLGYHLPMGTN